MFNQDSIIEFINKIVNQVEDQENEDTETNLRKFRAYLELTEMCDSDTLARVDKVLDCYESLVNIKRSFGFVDVSSLFKKDQNTAKKLVKKRVTKPVQPKDEYEDKHYRHYSSSYHEPVSSSGCGGSVSYSSGCGCGSSYRSGC